MAIDCSKMSRATAKVQSEDQGYGSRDIEHCGNPTVQMLNLCHGEDCSRGCAKYLGRIQSCDGSSRGGPEGLPWLRGRVDSEQDQSNSIFPAGIWADRRECRNLDAERPQLVPPCNLTDQGQHRPLDGLRQRGPGGDDLGQIRIKCAGFCATRFDNPRFSRCFCRKCGACRAFFVTAEAA
jgi:hypothetical protein